MKPNIELIITGGTTSGYTSISGILDLIGDEQINLVYSIADIKDISKRKGSFSQSFSLPGTKNNSLIFNSIFEINIDSSFNPQRKAPCIILVDTIPIAEGNLQLKSINVDKQNNVLYEVVFYGVQDDLIGSIGDGYLTDLDWSELSHPFTLNNVVHSWSASTAGNPYPYFHSLIDYGYDWDANSLSSVGLYGFSGISSTLLYPATNAKYIFDKIFSAAGYDYSSVFLNSDLFKNYYVPFNGDGNNLLGADFGKNRQFKATMTSQINFPASAFTSVYASNTTLTGYKYIQLRVPANNDSTNGNFDNGGFYDNTTFIYTADTESIQRFTANIGWNLLSPFHGQPITVAARFYRSGYLGGTQPFYKTEPYYAATTYGANQVVLQTPWLDKSTINQFSNLSLTQSGETFWVDFYFASIFRPNVGISASTIVLYLLPGTTYFYNEVKNVATAQQTVDYNLVIPKKIKQVDFVKSILTMHNIFVDVDKDYPKTLKLEPRDIYFTGGTTLDWTDKFDNSKKVDIQLTSEQQSKKTIFTYKADKDYFNEDYTSKENRIYGDYYYTNDNEWLAADSEKKIDIIFSPTPVTEIPTAPNFIIPKIGKSTTQGSINTFGRTDSNVRLLQKNNDSLISLTSSASTWTLNELQSGQIVKTSFIDGYPYLGHLDHPLTGTTDLNFGQVDSVYYDNDYGLTDGNLITLYWKKYLDEISDKNSKIISAYFYLTPVDISNLNFADSIYIEGLTTDGGAYFNINKIEYSPTANMPSKVELVKLKNKTVVRTEPLYVKPIYRGPLSGLLNGNGNTSSPRTILNGNGGTIGTGSDGTINSGFGNDVGSNSFFTTIVGGFNNTAGKMISVIGGTGNTLGGTYGNTADTEVELFFVAAGNDNIASYSKSSSVIGGDNNVVSGDSESYSVNSSIVGGNNNLILNSKYATIIGGENNVFSAVTGSTLIGVSDQTITTSNTLYVPNLYLTASGATINGISISAITSASNAFSGLTASTGTNSIVANNGTGNLANGSFSFAGGKNNRASGNTSSIVSGKNNIAIGLYSSIGSGVGNTAHTWYSIIVGGSGNTVAGWASFIGSGIYNTANGGAAAVIGGGISNIIAGPYSNRSVLVGGGYNYVTGAHIFLGGGYENSAVTQYSTVCGGRQNFAYGNRAFIGGGVSNTTSGDSATIAGGNSNRAFGQTSTVGGGVSNTASGKTSTVSGGDANKGVGYASFIGGGRFNTATGIMSVVGGGFYNTATGNYSLVSGRNNKAGNYTTVFGKRNSHTASFGLMGGSGNTCNSDYSCVVGGKSNNIVNANAFIGVGNYNQITSSSSVIVGGNSHYLNGSFAFVGNGYANRCSPGSGAAFVGNGGFNTTTSAYSSVINGLYNTASASYAFVGGGKFLRASGSFSSVLSGFKNSATTTYSTVLGGAYNVTKGSFSIVGAGASNSATTTYSGVLAGQTNRVSGIRAVIGGGNGNIITGDESFIGAGATNLSSGADAFIGGGVSNSATTSTASVLGGSSNLVSGSDSSIGGGQSNTISGNISFIGAGLRNTVSGTRSAILTGSGNTLSGTLSSILAGSGITSSLAEVAIAKGFSTPTGQTNSTAGTAILVGGAVTINTTKVTAKSMIFVCAQVLGTVVVATALAVTARTPGTSFTITSANATDTSTVSWWILEPAS